MRYYFFGDIHGNIYALDECVRHIKQVNPDVVCCLGDIVGWLPWGRDTLEAIMDMNIPCVAGNHDLLVVGALTDDPAQIDRMQASAYNAGTIWHKEEYRKFLENLPLKLQFPGFVVVHHCPFELPDRIEAIKIEHFSYFNPEKLEDYRALWSEGLPDLIISGHDHVPMVIIFHAGGKEEHIPIPLGAEEWTLKLETGVRYWVKAGAVGGPYRDGAVVVNSLVFDDTTRSLTFYRIAYDSSELIDRLRHHRFFRNIPTIQKYIRTAKAWGRR